MCFNAGFVIRIYMELWIILSLVAMFANVGKVLIVNRLCYGVDSRVLVLCGRLVATVLLLPILIIVNRSFPLDIKFWVVVAVTAGLTAFASVLYTEAIKKGKLSSVMPMQAAVPVFTLLTLFIVDGQSPKSESILFMVVSMAAVAYTLYQSGKEKDKGGGEFIFVVYSVIAAVLFGVCTFMDKVAIGSVVNGALAYSACWNLASLVIMIFENIRTKNIGGIFVRKNISPICLFSIVTVIAFFSQQYAVQKAMSIDGSVVNVKSIVMLHLPIIILLSFYLPGEKPSKRILLGGLAAVLAGILLVRSVI